MATKSTVENIWQLKVQWRTYGDKRYSGEHMATKSTVENTWRQEVQWRTYGDKKYSGEHMATRSTVENIYGNDKARLRTGGREEQYL